MFKDYYKILGITIGASSQEIKSAYYTLSKKWHPDMNPGKDVTSIMQDINEAYAILKDETKKARYDKEYRDFQNTYSNSSENSSNQQPDSSTQDSSDYNYTYNYNVKDDTLKEDIKSAREYAHELVKNFLDSLKESSKKAAKGAWENTKYYLFGVIILSIFGLLISMCNGNADSKYDSITELETIRDNNSMETVSSITYESDIVRKLRNFKIPDDWNHYDIANSAFSIAVPPTVELRHKYDNYTQLIEKHLYKLNSDVIVFQQKGLGKKTSNFDNHYCRIMLQYISSERGDFLKKNEVEKIDLETAAFFKELVLAELGPETNRLLEEPTYEWIQFNGCNAVEIKYRRSGNDDNTTSCKLYLIFNDSEMVKMIVSYRESEEYLWKRDLEHIINTFVWN